MELSYSTIRKFTTDTQAENLAGGQNESVKVGEVVLKPIHDQAEYLWVSEVLNSIDFGDLRIIKPLKSSLGNYIEDSFGATPYFKNSYHSYNLKENIRVCRQLNECLKNVPKPPSLFENLNNPWKKSQFLAWFEVIPNGLPEEVIFLLNCRKSIDLPHQLVHVDLANNILVDNQNQVAIIDFTPGFYPKQYAEALLIIDTIAWYQGKTEHIKEIELENDLLYQLILRALLFRISIPLFLEKKSNEKEMLFRKELRGYDKVFKYIQRKLLFFTL